VIKVKLIHNQPLDLASTFQSGQVFVWRQDGSWWNGVLGDHLIMLREQPGVLEFRTTLRPESRLIPLLYRYFRLDDDLASIQASLSKDTRVAEAIHHYPGLRLLRQDPWPCLAAFICSSNTNILRIIKMIDQLSLALGQVVSIGGVTRSVFPSATIVADAGEVALRELGLGYRARYLAETAKIITENSLKLERLREMSFGDARNCLLKMAGVGDKVADCVLLFSLEKPQSFPIDRWVRRVLEESYSIPRELPYQLLMAWAQNQFGPYAGYAQQYLFHRRRVETKL
jgi:N-glycosylase/DNA lyase